MVENAIKSIFSKLNILISIIDKALVQLNNVLQTGGNDGEEKVSVGHYITSNKNKLSLPEEQDQKTNNIDY